MRSMVNYVAILAFAVVMLPQTLPTEGKRRIASGQVHSFAMEMPSPGMMRVLVRCDSALNLEVRLTTAAGATVIERKGRSPVMISGVADSGSYRLVLEARKGQGEYSILQIRRGEPNQILLQADSVYSGAQSAEAFEEAASLYAQSNEADSRGFALFNGGQQHIRASDFKRAAADFDSAAKAFHDAGNLEDEARALNRLAEMRNLLRDYSSAIEAALKALHAAQAVSMRNLESSALSILGSASSSLGQKQRALDYFAKALLAARDSKDLKAESEALTRAAALHRTLGSFEQALSMYQQAVAIQQATGDSRSHAATLSNMASLYASMGQYAKAIQYFEKAIPLLRNMEGARLALARSLSNSGRAYIESKLPRKAVGALEEALTIFRESGSRFDEGYTLSNLGAALHGANEKEKAAQTLRAALDMSTEVGEPEVEICTRLEIARVEHSRGNLDAALDQVAQAIHLIETLRSRISAPDLRSSLVASARPYYELHTRILMESYQKTGSAKYLRGAFESAERGRARSLLDILGLAGVGAAESKDPELNEQERRLRQELKDLSGKRTALLRAKAPIADIDRRIASTWSGVQSIRAKILDEVPRSALLAPPLPVAVHTVQQDVLDSETLLLEYFLGAEKSYLWAINEGEVHGFELSARAAIEDAARTFWNATKSGERAAVVELAATRLSQLVLAPARALLGRKRLLIVADGMLQYVPFAVLADPLHQGGYRPLIVTHEVVSAPSVSTLDVMRKTETKRAGAPKRLAVFADPVFEENDPRLRRSAGEDATVGATSSRGLTSTVQLSRLPSTRIEGHSIASLVPPKDRLLALDFDATREAAVGSKLQQYRIVHFATHGIIDSDRPELSSLALSLYDARGTPRDGFLRLYDIYDLNLQADLVVLSACQTALGKSITGEGLASLSRGFMYAGTPRVVASLWQVDDRATGELMRLFYLDMLGPTKRSAAAALRSAQLAIMRQERWRSPYYWAAFVLQGEWK